MIIGNRNRSNSNIIPVIVDIGQSNSGGRALSARLANPSFNYKGISTGYPNVRTSQPTYSKTNNKLHVYWKDYSNITYDTDYYIDNSQWLTYDADLRGRAQAANLFGKTLSLGTSITDLTGEDCAVLYPAFGGTNLCPNFSTSPPGHWNNSIRAISAQNIRWGMRDLRALFPNKEPKLVAVLWHQGENDGGNNISQATYQANLVELMAYFDSLFKELFTIDLNSKYLWLLYKLQYQGSNFTLINNAIQAVVNSRSDARFISLDAYPRRDQLTTLQCVPVPFTTGAGNDDEHTSYIGQLAGGELAFNQIVSLL